MAVTVATLLVQREENVLAQEAVLDALLRCEEQENPWRWGNEGQLDTVGVVVIIYKKKITSFPVPHTLSVLQP